MFNLGSGEVTVLVLLGLIFLGPMMLPELAEQMRAQVWRVRQRPRVDHRQRWSRSEWLLVGVALIVSSFALALAIVGR